MICLGLVAAQATWGQDGVAVRVHRDIEYANADGHALSLDLYTGKDEAPLLIWVHGGAWRRGSKASMPLSWLIQEGYAIASVDYRLSPVARFPAQIHDLKAAIRFLRGNVQRWNYNATRVGIAGASAGGHLAALVGVTNRHPELEGSLGAYPAESSEVQAIVDYYGPTNFLTILKQSTPHGLGVRIPALKLLLGDQPDRLPRLAQLASPVTHVDRTDPPLLLIHGDQDPQVPINQSHELQGAYRRVGNIAELEVVYGGAHGGDLFHDEARQKIVAAFLNRHLQRSSAAAR